MKIDLAPADAFASKARLARLTLQLRASELEAAVAEAEEEAFSRDEELADAVSRRQAVVEEHRLAHEHNLATARTQVAEAIADAQRQAARIIADADAKPDEGAAGTAEIVEAAPVTPTLTREVVSVQRQPAIMIDATELADAIAGAMARVLEQQNDFWRSTATFERTESPAAPARPRTAARHAMHLDVVLSGLAALFVLVILLAWLG